ncbi:hypothetical protein T492DRAFT_862437 [Pavlovales sp. CCMP2436]|nr:hypothetical protein T492DRAFT_862437 [Pavlovales sp. CCMP2436]
MGSRDAPWQRWLLGGPLATEAGVSLIVLLVSLAYEPSLSGPATFTHIDDQDNFVNHPLLARVAVEGLSAHTLARLWLPQSVTLGVWEPVATLLKVAITRVCGLGSALPFVRVSVGLHICNCAAAYALACRVLSLLRLRGDHRPVLLAAVLLGVSPLCAEAVAWASGQPYVLAGSFSLLHLWLHLRRYHPSVAERQRGAWVPSALRVLLAFAAAALCKAAALTVFVVPATIDLLMHGPGRRLRLLETPTRYSKA